jgi:hypothetical protein
VLYKVRQESNIPKYNKNSNDIGPYVYNHFPENSPNTLIKAFIQTLEMPQNSSSSVVFNSAITLF